MAFIAVNLFPPFSTYARPALLAADQIESVQKSKQGRRAAMLADSKLFPRVAYTYYGEKNSILEQFKQNGLELVSVKDGHGIEHLVNPLAVREITPVGKPSGNKPAQARITFHSGHTLLTSTPYDQVHIPIQPSSTPGETTPLIERIESLRKHHHGQGTVMLKDQKSSYPDPKEFGGSEDILKQFGAHGIELVPIKDRDGFSHLLNPNAIRKITPSYERGGYKSSPTFIELRSGRKITTFDAYEDIAKKFHRPSSPKGHAANAAPGA